MTLGAGPSLRDEQASAELNERLIQLGRLHNQIEDKIWNLEDAIAREKGKADRRGASWILDKVLSCFGLPPEEKIKAMEEEVGGLREQPSEIEAVFEESGASDVEVHSYNTDALEYGMDSYYSGRGLEGAKGAAWHAGWR